MKTLRIPARDASAKGTLTVDADTAMSVRRIAAEEGRSRALTALLDDMIRAYLAAEHPDWRLVGAGPARRKP
jgi:hypothetical protein